ncbi:MAG: hypothetical protein HXS54_16735, partial [Theionarchaea archaeon]|nr:hypothetical protein [Theionarchaea archaeon]
MDYRGIGDLSVSDSILRILRIGVLMAFLILGFFSSTIGALTQNSVMETDSHQSFDQMQHCFLRDAAPVSEESEGYTKPPVYEALEICESDDLNFEYMAHSPYYKVYFKGSTVRMSVHDAWIEFELRGIGKGELREEPEKSKGRTSVNGNVISVSDIVESVDVSFEVETSLLTEMLVIKEIQPIERIIMNMSLRGVTPVLQEDGSILFLREDGKETIKVLPPFMKDSGGSICTDIHYELIETGIGHELHKVVDDKGMEWLKEAVYPITIDPSMQTFEDAWESSGLSPLNQYFESLQEYVNPSNGHLTVTQSDLVIPGRGLDLVISRVYEMPAIFYGDNPYGGEYEAPPVDVGKGWQLDFPWVGTKYLHLWNGTIYKIEWVNNTFENHEGSHFILVKNGDNTYSLTTASGRV